MKINALKAVYFLSTNDASYSKISNLNDFLKGFIIDVDKDIKGNNSMMNTNKENDGVKIKLMWVLRNKLMWWNQANRIINNNNFI